MMSYEDAYRLALKQDDRIVSANQLEKGWAFFPQQPTDEDGRPLPGGPAPIVVLLDGHTERADIITDRGFELLTAIVRPSIPLPDPQ